jgi:hypothetical protein
MTRAQRIATSIAWQLGLGFLFVVLERIPVTWKRSLHVGSNWRTLAD